MGGWLGGWVWLKGPRVVSVTWLSVTFSRVKKTSLFVKLPQEQNVPLLQEQVTCLCVCVCVCRSRLGGWLACWISVAFVLWAACALVSHDITTRLVTHRHDQKRDMVHSNLRNFTLTELVIQTTLELNKTR